jgi:hypothetical protein
MYRQQHGAYNAQLPALLLMLQSSNTRAEQSRQTAALRTGSSTTMQAQYNAQLPALLLMLRSSKS